eukprot:s254_g46.t1
MGMLQQWKVWLQDLTVRKMLCGGMSMLFRRRCVDSRRRTTSWKVKMGCFQMQLLVCITVMLGGYTNYAALTAAERQRMYIVEKANLIAARTMGSNRYMATVLPQSRGSGYGEDTDIPMADGAAASSSRAASAPVNVTSPKSTTR